MLSNDPDIKHYYYGASLYLESKIALLNLIRIYVDYDSEKQYTYGFAFYALRV